MTPTEAKTLLRKDPILTAKFRGATKDDITKWRNQQQLRLDKEVEARAKDTRPETVYSKARKDHDTLIRIYTEEILMANAARLLKANNIDF